VSPRVILDVRPLQEPDRAPITAAYLRRLLRAVAAAPRTGESFVLLGRADLPEPGPPVDELPISARRILPATRFLRAASLTVDPFLVRGAAIGSGPGLRGRGSVWFAPGTILPIDALPIGGRPVVAVLLDLAPWQLPRAFQRSPAARFGTRLRLRLLRDARIVAVGTSAVADLAARRLRIPRERLRVVPLAARDAFVATAGATGARTTEQARLGLAGPYYAWAARHDARQDVATLLAALGSLARDGRPEGHSPDEPWPPRILVIEAAPDDRAAVARSAARAGLGDAFAYAPALPDDRLAALVAGSRGAIAPVVSDAAGLPVIDALAAGVPVVASAVGALPELVGPAGILVPPRSPERLAAALRALWVDHDLHARLASEARASASPDGGPRRTWADVARDVRELWAEAAAG